MDAADHVAMRDEAFINRTMPVLILEDSVIARQQLATAVTRLGFLDVATHASFADVMRSLEAKGHSAWVIAPVATGHGMTALDFLTVCQRKSWSSMRLTLLSHPDDHALRLHALSAGALSCMPRALSPVTVNEELNLLFRRHRTNDFLSPLTAADYIRDVLKTQSRFSDIVDLEMKLLDIFPGHPRALIALAEAQHAMSHDDDAKISMTQAMLLAPNLTSEIRERGNRWFARRNWAIHSSTISGNPFGLDHCVVIDPDDTMQKTVAGILETLGARRVSCFGNGIDAWFEMQESPPSLVVHEWRLPGLSGPHLIQRMRKAGLHEVPIVTISSLLRQSDVHLAREMRVATVIPKPIRQHEFITRLVHVLQQQRMPSRARTAEMRMRTLLAAQKYDMARLLGNAYLADPSIPAASKQLMEAEFLFHQGHFDLAKRKAVQSLRQKGDALFVFNLLGRTLMQLREFSLAVRCLRKAQTFAPLNVHRLCAIAEGERDLGNFSESDSAIKDAQRLDPGFPGIPESEARMAILNGNVERAREILSIRDDLARTLVSDMNNRAVSLTKEGKAESGIMLLRDAMLSVPEESRVRTTVAYNLGLALARANRLQESRTILSAIPIGTARIQRKSQSLLRRVTHSLQSGEPLRMQAATIAGNAGEKPKPSSAEKALAAPTGNDRGSSAHQTIAPGSMGCFLIFTPPDSEPAQDAS